MNAAPRLCRTRRAAAAIGVVAMLAGCSWFRDDRPVARHAPPVHDKSAAASTKSGAAGQNDAAVSLDRHMVKHLQTQLARLGFRPGPIDGIFGPLTAGAVRRYQTAHRLPVTGQATRRLLRHLHIAVPDAKPAEQPAPAMTADDFPKYHVGTTFIYSDGEMERVAAVMGPVVRWVRSDGTTYAAHRNFLMPWSYWATDDERGTTTISRDGDALWPLKEGAEVEFSAEVIVQRKGDTESTERRVDRWHCRQGGHRDVTVEAGTFDARVFVCRRGAKSGRPELVRTWYYAMSIGHYVRVVESHPDIGITITTDLVAVRPGAAGWPPIVRAALARAVVHALETRADGARMPWTSSGVSTHVTIEAKSRFVDDDGRQCRHFVQIWSDNGLNRHYPAVACQSVSGQWEIPGLEGNSMESLATSGGLS